MTDTAAPKQAAADAGGKRSRNLVTATIVGLGLFAGVVGSAILGPFVFGAVLYIACGVAVYEWRTALASKQRTIPLVPLLIGTAVIGACTVFYGATGLTLGMFAACIIVVAWRGFTSDTASQREQNYVSIMTLAWIPFLGSFLMLMELSDHSWRSVVVFVVAVVAADTGALVTGMLWGKTPLHKRVSPNKTWEGFAGGLALSVVIATVFAAWLLDGTWWVGTVVSVIAAVTSVVGDLAESAIKRSLQIKDMSQLIPGHGGLMDRMDSMFFAAPLAFGALTIVAQL